MFKVKLKNYIDLTSVELSDEGNNTPLNIGEFAANAQYNRSPEFFGIFRSISTRLIFVKEGKEYIERFIQLYGVGNEIYVTIEYSENIFDFDIVFNGVLDLKTFESSKTEHTLSVMLVSSSFENKIITNIDKDFGFNPINNLQKKVVIRPRKFEYYATLKSDSQSEQINNSAGTILAVPQSKGVVGENSSIKQTFVHLIGKIEDILGDDEAKYLSISPSAFLIANANLRYNVSGNVKIYITASVGHVADIHINLARLDEKNQLIENTEIKHVHLMQSQMGNVTITFDAENLELRQKEKVILVILNHQTSPLSNYKITKAHLDISVNEAHPESVHRAIKLNDILSSIISKITDTENRLISKIFSEYPDGQNRLQNIMLLNGMMLRISEADVLNEEQKITLSIKKIFKALNGSFCLGIGIENNRLIFDHRAEFFKPTIIHEFDEFDVSDFTTEFDESFLFNAFEISNKTQKENENGLNEFIGKSTYQMPIDYVSEKQSSANTFICDGATIEKIRKKVLSLFPDENVNEDNELFLLQTEYMSGNFYQVYNPAQYYVVSHSMPDNSFLTNIDMWQPLAFRFWATWLLSLFKYHKSELLKIENFTNNMQAVLNIGGSHISFASDADIYIKDLVKYAKNFTSLQARNALFEPIVYKFKTKVTKEYLQKFEANRHGVIKFTYENKIYYGFILTAPAMPNQYAEFRLLKCSFNIENLL